MKKPKAYSQKSKPDRVVQKGKQIRQGAGKVQKNRQDPRKQPEQHEKQMLRKWLER